MPTGDIIGAPSDKASVTGVPNAMWRRVSTAIMTCLLLCAQTVQAQWFQAPEYSRQLPTAAEAAEIAGLASAATPPRSLYLGAEDNAPLLSCIVMLQDPANGYSLILQNRCNFGLDVEGFVSGYLANGKCPSKTEGGRLSEIFHSTLMPGETDSDFAPYQNCIAQIHDLKVQPPELLFEQRLGPRISSIEEWQEDNNGNRIWWQELAFDKEASAQFPKSNLCWSNFSVDHLIGGSGFYPYKRQESGAIALLWYGVKSARIGERSVTVKSSEIERRHYRINFLPGVDRKEIAEAVNRILYRCQPR
ncbi:hypothetical protein [Sphingosinicella microcystinivorans]|uniref:Uncharacterized protein n=1 Tax=Sphingosinicella microcystinivorans TaxID=335406 RepID=A0AAD1D3W0_SPHMI|nr:hypothetical protein [Sphingosinicella microcystinivorans]RKS85021.1 hypothetical protein DFR51_3621 [Sphingosinicella microcystinivorans]BBE33321.1 hypothetical protein SmB9_09790 [Sphingosinicella microcystinivorans]